LMSEIIATATDSRRTLRTIKAAQILTQSFTFKVGELGELIKEGQIDCVGRAVALLRNDQFSNVLILIAAIVNLFAIDECDKVRILFDCTRLTEVSELRTMIGAVLGRARQLRQRNERDIQFLRQRFQLTRNL